MSRVKSGKVTHARHKKVLDAAKGYYGNRSRNFRTATQAVDKANQYATRDRKNRKRNFRALWIQRINAAVRAVDADRDRLPAGAAADASRILERGEEGVAQERVVGPRARVPLRGVERADAGLDAREHLFAVSHGRAQDS